jgi:hypothetical protein
MKIAAANVTSLDGDDEASNMYDDVTKSGDVQTPRKIADLLKISLDDLVVPVASIDAPRKRKAANR